MPFSKSIAATDLFPRAAHAEAVARIGLCIAEGLLGALVGDVGCGKTVAVRAAVAGLDRTRHQIIYIPNCAFGARGLYVAIVTALGGCRGTASPSSSPIDLDGRELPLVPAGGSRWPAGSPAWQPPPMASSGRTSPDTSSTDGAPPGTEPSQHEPGDSAIA